MAAGQAFRKKPWANKKALHLATAARGRLRRAYDQGVPMCLLIERFGLSEADLKAELIAAGVVLPPGTSSRHALID